MLSFDSLAIDMGLYDNANSFFCIIDNYVRNKSVNKRTFQDPNIFEIFEIFEVQVPIGSDLPFIPWDFSKSRILNIGKVRIGANIKCFDNLVLLSDKNICVILHAVTF